MTARPTALVTGGSSGIGLELARRLGRGGYDLVLVARRESRLLAAAAELRAAAGGSVTTIPADLSDEVAVRRALETIHASAVEVDVLVNNAGFGAGGAFAEAPLDAQLGMIALNVAALTHLTGALLPGMVARRRGRILNVASTAAFQPGPFMAVYYATKAYVLSFSEAIAEELRGTGVTVTALCPGPTHTGFAARARLGAIRAFGQDVAMSAAAVAEAGYEGMQRGERVVIPGTGNRVLAAAARLAPRALVTRIGRRLHERRAVTEPPADSSG